MTKSSRKSIRSEMRTVLQHLDKRWVEAAGERVGEQVEQLLERFDAPPSKELLGWMSFFPGEIDLSSLIMRELDRRAVYLPRSLPDFTLEYVSIGMDWQSAMTEGNFGIPEPVLSSGSLLQESLVDPRERAVLIPGLAFDRSGNRIGRGKGYYDRFLASEQGKRARKIGVCYSLQVVDSVPAEPHDVPVDWLCTEEETVRVSFRQD